MFLPPEVEFYDDHILLCVKKICVFVPVVLSTQTQLAVQLPHSLISDVCCRCAKLRLDQDNCPVVYRGRSPLSLFK